MFSNAILFSHKAGQLLNGVQKTPKILKKFIKPNIKVNYSPVNNSLFLNIRNLYETNKNISGNRVNIGGDHSMSIATVADSLDKYPNLKVIWMDAHCDINTYEKSLSKNYHGMPLGILTGLEKDKSLNFSNRLLNFENILYIGTRDIDDFEKDIVEKEKITTISVDEVHQNIEEVFVKINKFINNQPVHFSFDVDVLDSSVMPSTGTIAKNGIHLEPCKKIIDKIMSHQIISMDITELNLDIGDEKECKKSLDNLKYLFKQTVFK